MAHRLACWRRRKRGTNDTALEFGNVPDMDGGFACNHQGNPWNPTNSWNQWKSRLAGPWNPWNPETKKGKKPLLLNSYSSHLFRPFSYAGAQHGVNLCESAPLGGIHLVSISKNPPLVPLNNFLYSFTWSQKLPLWPLNNFLHASQLGFNV